LPLYRGTILAVRQDWGGAEVMALAFKKLAKLSVPVVPMNFNKWGGKALYPRLFVALYFFCNINCNSPGVIRYGVGSVSGEY
jgi:hypothetical protein